MANQRAGINLADTDDALCLQFIFQAALRAPVGGNARQIADNKASCPNLVSAGLVVLIVPTGVADLWCGSHNQLAVVGRVRQGFLVARHSGGKNCLTQGCTGGAETASAEHSAICQYQDCRCSGRGLRLVAHVIAFQLGSVRGIYINHTGRM